MLPVLGAFILLQTVMTPTVAHALSPSEPMMAVELDGVKLSIRVDGWMGAEFDEPDLPGSLRNYPTKNPRAETSANQILKQNKRYPRRYKLRAFWYSLGRGCKERVIPSSICQPPAGYRMSEVLIVKPSKLPIPIKDIPRPPASETQPMIFASQTAEEGRCEPPQAGLSCTFRVGIEGQLLAVIYLGTAKGSVTNTSDLLIFAQNILNYLIRVEERSN